MTVGFGHKLFLSVHGKRHGFINLIKFAYDLRKGFLL